MGKLVGTSFADLRSRPIGLNSSATTVVCPARGVVPGHRHAPFGPNAKILALARWATIHQLCSIPWLLQLSRWMATRWTVLSASYAGSSCAPVRFLEL